jgi:hypothetical protein
MERRMMFEQPILAQPQPCCNAVLVLIIMAKWFNILFQKLKEAS